MSTVESHGTFFLFFKPFGVLSQFTSGGARPCIKDFGPFPSSVYPVGRLDFDSEGLLILTDNAIAQHRMTDPRYAHPKTYLVQVEGTPTFEALGRLRRGVDVQGVRTKPAFVRTLDQAPSLPEREVPIRVRKSIPATWLELTIVEGRNRQVRRMTAAVGLPTLRLVRVRIGDLSLGTLLPGQHRQLGHKEIVQLIESIGGQSRGGKRNPGTR